MDAPRVADGFPWIASEKLKQKKRSEDEDEDEDEERG